MKIGDKLTGELQGFSLMEPLWSQRLVSQVLIHISEIRTGFIENIYDVLKSVKKFKFRLSIWMNIQVKQVFSIRTLEEEKHQLPRRRRFSSDRVKYGFAPLARMMPIWTKEAISNLNKKKS